MLDKLANMLRRKTEAPKRQVSLGEGLCWEFEEASNGYGGYHKVNAWLLKEDDPGFRRCLLNRDGIIQNFPGVKKTGWEKGLEFPLDHKARFAFRIGRFRNGQALVSWTLQPDGQYFEDEDGFGAENCEEITLYAWLDQNGRFTEAFRVWEDESADSTAG